MLGHEAEQFHVRGPARGMKDSQQPQWGKEEVIWGLGGPAEGREEGEGVQEPRGAWGGGAWHVNRA